jgi:hypothetical protein
MRSPFRRTGASSVTDIRRVIRLRKKLNVEAHFERQYLMSRRRHRYRQFVGGTPRSRPQLSGRRRHHRCRARIGKLHSARSRWHALTSIKTICRAIFAASPASRQDSGGATIVESSGLSRPGCDGLSEQFVHAHPFDDPAGANFAHQVRPIDLRIQYRRG